MVCKKVECELNELDVQNLSFINSSCFSSSKFFREENVIHFYPFYTNVLPNILIEEDLHTFTYSTYSHISTTLKKHCLTRQTTPRIFSLVIAVIT